MRRPPQSLQMLGSLLVALAIAAIAIAVVTSHFGPTSVAKLDAQEERLDTRVDAREEAQKEREDAAQEREKAAEDSGGGGHSGHH
ncbi:MAG: hypothetical protein JJE35_07985 [Thermoleophilia bacterium]|nr:hypothetical protein [Thermoleophilia bacterium]